MKLSITVNHVGNGWARLREYVSKRKRMPLDDRLGLHDDIHIYYAVDRIVAEYRTSDGRRLVATGEGRTVTEALDSLKKKVSDA